MLIRRQSYQAISLRNSYYVKTQELQHLIYIIIICDKGSMNIYVFLFSFLPFFVLTCAKLFQDKEGAKLLVVTGNGLGGSSGYFPDSEVVDLGSDIDRNCNGWTEFPFEISLATGALFNIDSDKETEGTF